MSGYGGRLVVWGTMASSRAPTGCTDEELEGLTTGEGGASPSALETIYLVVEWVTHTAVWV